MKIFDRYKTVTFLKRPLALGNNFQDISMEELQNLMCHFHTEPIFEEFLFIRLGISLSI